MLKNDVSEEPVSLEEGNVSIGDKDSIKEDNFSSDFENRILFSEEEKLIEYVEQKLLLPNEEQLKLLKEQLNLDEQIRTIGIARAYKMISDYEKQDQLLTMISLVLTIIGIAFQVAKVPAGIVVFYFVLLIILFVYQAIKINQHRKNAGIATYLKTLLERTSIK